MRASAVDCGAGKLINLTIRRRLGRRYIKSPCLSHGLLRPCLCRGIATPWRALHAAASHCQPVARQPPAVPRHPAAATAAGQLPRRHRRHARTPVAPATVAHSDPVSCPSVAPAPRKPNSRTPVMSHVDVVFTLSPRPRLWHRDALRYQSTASEFPARLRDTLQGLLGLDSCMQTDIARCSAVATGKPRRNAAL